MKYSRLCSWGGLIGMAILLSQCATPTTSPTATIPPTVEPTPKSTEPAPTPAPTMTESPPAPKPFRVIGYFYSWGDASDVDHVAWECLTHVNYAFMLAAEDGSISNSEPERLKQLVTVAHEHNVQVLVSIGGWGQDRPFAEFAASPERRTRFITQVLQAVEDYDLDGVDIDWEYPSAESRSVQDFVDLMSELRTELAPKGKLLTAAVSANHVNGDGISEKVFPLVDFLNIMAYDGPDQNHASMPFTQAALDYWTARGLPQEKMVLGVPFYGRSPEVSYRKLVELDPQAAQSDEWEYQGSRVYYNGIPTIQEKTRMARRQASGIMIWALQHDTEDDTSLLKAIAEAARQP